MTERYAKPPVAFIRPMTGMTQVDKISELIETVWNEIFSHMDAIIRTCLNHKFEFLAAPDRVAAIVNLDDHPSHNYLSEVLIILHLLVHQLQRLITDSNACGQRIKHFVGDLMEANGLLSGHQWKGIRAEDVDGEDARSSETITMLRRKLDQLKNRIEIFEGCKGKIVVLPRYTGSLLPG